MLLSRRKLLMQGLLLAASAKISASQLLDTRKTRKFKIGACDWSIGKSSDIGAFEVAKQIGLDGLMVNMGSLQNNLHLRDQQVQKDYLSASRETGIKIASLAIGELNNYPYKSDPQTEQWVWDSIDVAKNLGVEVVLLAFFHKNDLRNDAQGIEEVIRRLKQVAPKAEKIGITLGIESYLDAAGHLNIIEKVGSKNVKAYMDFRNTADAGHDPIHEMKLLGKQNVCELHMKENGALLGKGDLQWQKIRDLMYDMEYYGDGWMQIEGSIPDGGDTITSYKHNLAFLRQLFSKKA